MKKNRLAKVLVIGGGVLLLGMVVVGAINSATRIKNPFGSKPNSEKMLVIKNPFG